MCKTKNSLAKTAIAATIKAICALNPVSSAIDAFRTEFVAASETARRDYWEEEFIKRISDIDEIEEKIRQYSNFASLLASARYGAYTDIEAEKVPLYVNSVINAIKNEDINDTKKHIFLNFLKDFTLLHIKVLNFLANPPFLSKEVYPMYAIDNETYSSVFIENNKDCSENKDILDTISKDLYDKGLISLKSLSSELPIDNSAQYAYIENKLTDLGKQFLEFIKDND